MSERKAAFYVMLGAVGMLLACLLIGWLDSLGYL